MKAYFKSLRRPENNGKKIGLFRIVLAILGGFLFSHLAMTLLVFMIPLRIEEAIIIPILLNTFVWALSTLWISLSPSKYIALLRTFIPSIFFSITIMIFYNI